MEICFTPEWSKFSIYKTSKVLKHKKVYHFNNSCLFKGQISQEFHQIILLKSKNLINHLYNQGLTLLWPPRQRLNTSTIDDGHHQSVFLLQAVLPFFINDCYTTETYQTLKLFILNTIRLNEFQVWIPRMSGRTTSPILSG